MTYLIVGLGASAGGLDAFTSFFDNMPPESGMAFVLVQHLDPEHKSLLAELLSKHTPMPVVEAENGMTVAANQVFVIPPNATMTIGNGILHVERPAPPREHRCPINTFFTALAEDQGENAVCVILSGYGSDGTQGLKAIKEHGGFALAQAGGDETALLGMPSSAVSTGLVDEVMAVETMPARLLDYQQHLNKIRNRKEPDDGTGGDVAEYLTTICTLLRTRLGHDFSGYKDKTRIRRIQRRMRVLRIESVPEYVERLRKDPDQLALLFRDLLIGTTGFFRDPEAFAALESVVIPKLFEKKKNDGQIRIWVAGCATGEEAYSIAILVREAMVKLEVALDVQIFATDLDDQAILLARRGRYREPLSGLSPERLARWFVKVDDAFCVSKDLRDMCVFSVHDLVKDAPFPKLDLISCRNVLIYMDSKLQDRLVRTFHYALRPGGYLFLGASEALSRQEELFAVFDNEHCLFQRRDDAAPPMPGGALARAVLPQPSAPFALPAESIDRCVRRALEKYSPAYVVIDRQHEVLRFSSRTGPYVEPSAGPASLELFSILRKDLMLPVRAAVDEAFATRKAVVHENLVVTGSGDRKIVSLIVEPISANEEFLVVAFQDRGFVSRDGVAAESGEGADSRFQAVENELRATRTQLQNTIDDLEKANEELKSINEEYQSVNEEVLSSNEELRSTQAELQSLNEELRTVNAELNSKNDALLHANSDIANLLDSTEIATLFLDNDLHVKTFTPAISKIFQLRPSDQGRPISDIATRLSYAELELKHDVETVLGSLSMIEHEVTTAEAGTTFLMRIRPYRTLNDVIDGVVITFVDITERKHHEVERARLAAIVDSSQDAIIGHTLDGMITSWNPSAERIFGYAAKEAVGKPLSMLLPDSGAGELTQILQRLALGKHVEIFEITAMAKNGKKVDVSMTISPVRNKDGTIIDASTIVRDISERQRSDDLRNLMTDELNHRVKNTLATVQSIAAQSLRGTSDADARETFDARLVALSRTHDLLARQSWESASLRDLLLQELEPYGSKDRIRFIVEGPDLKLRPKAVLALGMAFHELATNAAKHGALSMLTGQVHVAWEIVTSAGSDMLRLKWTESGGPPVEKPERKGFGSTLLERGLALELDGEVRLDFARSGLVCIIEVPLPSAGEVEMKIIDVR